MKITRASLRELYSRHLPADSIRARLAKGSFWSLVGTLISRSLMLAANIIVARILGKEVFGEYGVVQNTVGLFGVFAGAALGSTATKYVAEFRNTDPVRAGRIILLSSALVTVTGALAGGGLALFARLLAERTLAAPHLTEVIRISALLLFVNAINGSQTGSLSGFEAFRSIAIINLISGLFSFPIIVAGVYFWDLDGVVVGLIAAATLNCILNHIALRIEAKRAGVPLVFRGVSREVKVLWNFSLPSVFTMVLASPVNWICTAMLVNQPDGYGELGLFNAAGQWRSVIILFPTLFYPVILPVLSDLNATSSPERFRRAIFFTLKISTIMVVVPAGVFVLFSPVIMKVYGSGFKVPFPLVALIMISTVISVLGTALFTILQSLGKVWYGFWGNGIWAVAYVSSFWALLHYKALGMAMALTISQVIAQAIIFYPIFRLLVQRREGGEETACTSSGND